MQVSRKHSEDVVGRLWQGFGPRGSVPGLIRPDLSTGRKTESSAASHFSWGLGAVLVMALVSLGYSQGSSDTALNAVRSSDRIERAANGKPGPQISPAEHMRRAGVYMAT